MIRSARDFQRAATGLHYAFHWFYADSRDIAYINTGDNPVRAKGVNQNFPVRAKFEWQGFNPDAYRARYVPFAEAAADDQPELHRELEQQVRARVPSGRLELGVQPRSTAPSCWRTG